MKSELRTWVREIVLDQIVIAPKQQLKKKRQYSTHTIIFCKKKNKDIKNESKINTA